MGVGLFNGLLGTHGLRVRSVWHCLFWVVESQHSKVAAFLHKSHFVGKDDVVEAAFKQSHIVEKKALESSDFLVIVSDCSEKDCPALS